MKKENRVQLMYHYRPCYYSKFRCINSACSDNCCIGWEIDIDEESMKQYDRVSGAFGCRLREHIAKTKDGSHFILRGERCPFLNEQNLCDIFIYLGESALCEICTEHPRFHEWYGSWKESGLGLCCEAVGELLFAQPSPLPFETVLIEEEAEDFVDDAWFSALFAARESAFFLLQYGAFSIEARLSLLLIYGVHLQDALDCEDTAQVKALASSYRNPDFLRETLKNLPMSSDPDHKEPILYGILDFYSSLESIDPKWHEHLQTIKENLPDVLSAQNDLLHSRPECIREYEQFAVYFTFRYFLKSIFDFDIRSRITLIALSCILLFLLDGEQWRTSKTFSLPDRVRLAKAYSKEIEYCEENLNAVADAAWEETYFSQKDLLSLFVS